MNILVVGGTRFVGAHTVAKLAESGHRVTVDWACENLPEEYDQAIFDYDAEDRVLALVDAEGQPSVQTWGR